MRPGRTQQNERDSHSLLKLCCYIYLYIYIYCLFVVHDGGDVTPATRIRLNLLFVIRSRTNNFFSCLLVTSRSRRLNRKCRTCVIATTARLNAFVREFNNTILLETSLLTKFGNLCMAAGDVTSGWVGGFFFSNSKELLTLHIFV